MYFLSTFRRDIASPAMSNEQGGATYHYNSLWQMDWETRTFTGLSGQTFRLNYTYGLSSQLQLRPTCKSLIQSEFFEMLIGKP
jgi:hypothetical protein